MADFMRALPFVLNNEGANLPHGGKCDIPGDTGGRTNNGISTPALADFNSCHPELGFPSDTWALTKDQIATVYRLGFWKFDGIDDQACATKIFDMDVNMGLPSGVLLAQKAANHLGAGIAEDDHYGPGTEAALNACDPAKLMDALVSVSNDHYQQIVAKHPDDQKFLSNWLHRATLVPA